MLYMYMYALTDTGIVFGTMRENQYKLLHIKHNFDSYISVAADIFTQNAWES